ncbi:MAG: nucleotidyltransferase domain-containing protein [Defluviitaleaceae bacterium]|nr:nucleotidyltransferase domain-containing protein [Defluviitaleaceae bacterium]
MSKTRLVDPRINAVTEKVLEAAKDTLGEKLDKVILFGSYARGDFDEESDMDFLIIAHVSQEEASMERANIRNRIPLIDLEYDIVVSLNVTGSEIYNNYVDILPMYKNVAKEGVLLHA